jgi:hypothetical protein
VRGPHRADPLKAWGDRLARQKRRTEALAWDKLKQASAAAARGG